MAVVCWICPIQNELMKYGYARALTGDQEAEMEHAALKKAACTDFCRPRILCGGTINHPALRRRPKVLENCDTLTVWKLDRLSRSVRDFVIMATDLKQRGVKLNSLSEHLDRTRPWTAP
jgi:DNA invertase Pin-like site-specific DNA recombinase